MGIGLDTLDGELLLMPVASVIFALALRYAIARVRGESARTRQVLTVWPDLMVVGVFNVLTIGARASQSAVGRNARYFQGVELHATEYMLAAVAVCFLIAIQTASYVPAGGKWPSLRETFWVDFWPHLTATGIVAFTVLWGSSAL